MSRKTVKFDFNPLFAGPTLEARSKSGNPFRYVPVADIDVDPAQPRKSFDADSLNELSCSIKEFGVLCPILVRLGAGGSYRVISGERRLRAAKMAGLDVIPVIVDQEEEEESKVLSKQLVENLQRQDLSPLERASAIGQLRERTGSSIRDLAKLLGLSKSLVQRSLDILSLPDDLQAALSRGAAESKVFLLSQIEQRELRKKLLQQLEDLSRTELERIVAEIAGRSKAANKLSRRGTKPLKARHYSVEEKRIIDDLEKSLATRVRLLRAKKPNQGKVVIDYYSLEELDGIYRRLMDE